MFDFIRGKVSRIDAPYVVIDRDGLGFRLLATQSCIATLTPGESAEVITELDVREDALTLLGFASSEERALFQLLRGVKGVGMKSALGILSATDTTEVVRAIVTEDVHGLTKAPGVGKKSAERIIVELKDRMDGFHMGGALPDEPVKQKVPEEDEAVLALLSLGYEEGEILHALEGTEASSSSERIRRALRILGGGF